MKNAHMLFIFIILVLSYSCSDGDTDQVEDEAGCNNSEDCDVNEYCTWENVCKECESQELPLVPYNSCISGNVVLDAGYPTYDDHCRTITLPYNEHTYLCPEGTLCYDLSEDERDGGYHDYRGVWSECRVYEDFPNWDDGIAGEWTDSGAYKLSKDGNDLECEEISDCFKADNNDNANMFVCTDNQCYGCVNTSRCDEACKKYMNIVYRCQFATDEYGCPINRQVMFECGEGNTCIDEPTGFNKLGNAFCVPEE